MSQRDRGRSAALLRLSGPGLPRARPALAVRSWALLLRAGASGARAGAQRAPPPPPFFACNARSSCGCAKPSGSRPEVGELRGLGRMAACTESVRASASAHARPPARGTRQLRGVSIALRARTASSAAPQQHSTSQTDTDGIVATLLPAVMWRRVHAPTTAALQQAHSERPARSRSREAARTPAAMLLGTATRAAAPPKAQPTDARGRAGGCVARAKSAKSERAKGFKDVAAPAEPALAWAKDWGRFDSVDVATFKGEHARPCASVRLQCARGGGAHSAATQACAASRPRPQSARARSW